MLLLPLEAFSKLSRGGVGRTLSLLASLGEAELAQLISTTKLSKKCVWQALRDLEGAELVVKRRGRYCVNEFYMRNGCVLINCRDKALRKIFRRKTLLDVLSMLSGHTDQNLAGFLSISHMSVRRNMADLRKVGITAEELGRQVYAPADPLEHVPRSAHREVLRHMLRHPRMGDVLERASAVVLFGEASYGMPVDELDVATVLSLTMSPEEHVLVMESLLDVKDNVEHVFRKKLNIITVIEDALLSEKLRLTASVNLTLARILDGICVFGKLPEPGDLFDLFMKAFPMSERDIEEKIQKGYITRSGNRLVFTDKAIEHFRQHAPTHIIDVEIPIRGRTVRMITIGRQTGEM